MKQLGLFAKYWEPGQDELGEARDDAGGKGFGKPGGVAGSGCGADRERRVPSGSISACIFGRPRLALTPLVTSHRV